jgi:hypothetical protein
MRFGRYLLLCQLAVAERSVFIRSRVSKGNTYHQAVEGYRDENGVVRQRTFSVWGATIEEALAAERSRLARYRRKRTEWKKFGGSVGSEEFAKWDRLVSKTEAKVVKLQDALNERQADQVDTTKA